MDVTQHPLFVPAAGILGALIVFAIVLFLSKQKKRSRKSLAEIEAERITDGVTGTDMVQEGDKLVRRSTRWGPERRRRAAAAREAVSAPRRHSRDVQVQEAPRAHGVPDAREGESAPQRLHLHAIAPLPRAQEPAPCGTH